MKLPEWTQEDEAALIDRDVISTPVELAQLHIWRSIAVSLEVIAISVVAKNSSLHLKTPEKSGKDFLKMITDCSVRECGDD